MLTFDGVEEASYTIVVQLGKRGVGQHGGSLGGSRRLINQKMCIAMVNFIWAMHHNLQDILVLVPREVNQV